MESPGGLGMVDNLAHTITSDTIINKNIEHDTTLFKWCSVSLSEILEKGKRLEARGFDVDAKAAYAAIESSKYEIVNLIGDDGLVEKAHYGGRLKRKYVSKSDPNAIGFIGSSEMLDTNPVPVKFMVHDDSVQLLHVKPGTVLISRSGTIGNLTYVSKTLEKLLVSEHAIRLECKKYPGYVYAYLKSDVGQTLIQSKIYGAVISQIEPEHLATIPIPNASDDLKNRIHTMIAKSYELRDESNDMIKSATELLSKELKLPLFHEIQFKAIGDAQLLAFDVKLSEIKSRLDASFHVPIVDAIIKHLIKYSDEVVSVGNPAISSKIILPGRFKRIYVAKGNGRVFIGGKQIFENDPSNKKYLSLVHHGARIAEQLELHKNMILITCSGTIGKVALVPRHWENWTANQHIIRIVPKGVEIAGYLSIFLSSDYGMPLITRFIYGSVVDEIDDKHVSQIPIPLLKNKSVQKEINDLAISANEKRYEAYIIEHKALSLMDDIISGRV